MSGQFSLFLQGPIVPYVRMTRRGMHRPDAQRYLASQEALKLQMRLEMARLGFDPMYGLTPLDVSISLGWVNHRQDLDNLAKAVLDAANGIVWPDDRWIDSLSVYRERGNDVVMLRVDAIG